jgi:hypothetical protein
MSFRLIILAMSTTMAFAVFEAWPHRLPRWCQRWVLQVVAVGASIPIAIFAMYVPFAPLGAPPFLEDNDWMLVTFAAMLVAPWTALAAIVRQKEAFVYHQPLAFALERSELERQTSTPVCICCRRRSPLISCSIRSPTSKRSSMRARRRRRQCFEA